MRHDPAPADQKLWRCLRDRQLGGFKIRRQRPMPPYIADFYCVQARLVIELDGDTHGDRLEYDARRTKRMQTAGQNVIRFVHDDVLWHLDDVLEEILSECDRLEVRKSPST
jgi:very-short-patch-repair endonuclease